MEVVERLLRLPLAELDRSFGAYSSLNYAARGRTRRCCLSPPRARLLM